MSLLKEFKEFAVKGNAVDLAVGIIVGGAFNKIVTSMVGDVIMPVVGKVLGHVNFTNLFLAMDWNAYSSLDEARKGPGPVLAYGSFIQQVVDFIIVAFCVFLLVKAINTLRRSEEPAPAAPAPISEEILLLREIRDGLKKR